MKQSFCYCGTDPQSPADSGNTFNHVIAAQGRNDMPGKRIFNSPFFILSCILLCLASCNMDEGIYIRPVELGAGQTSYIVSADPGTVDVEVLANQTVKLSFLNAVNWGSLSTNSVPGDAAVTFSYRQNTGFPRMAVILLSSENTGKCDTIYVKQEGVTMLYLSFPKISVSCKGAGGEIAVEIETNIPLEDMKVETGYPDAADAGWINPAMQIDNGKLMISTQPNTDDVKLRNATIQLSVVDGWGQLLSATLLLTQANAQEKFGELITYLEARDLSDYDTVKQDVYIEGVIVGNQASGNVGDTPNLTSTSWDKSVSPKTAYIQASDGSMGFKIMFNAEADNIYAFGSKVEMLLKGTHIEKEMDAGPVRYTITNVSLNRMLNATAGNDANVVKKEKYIGDLTPDDVYTYVTLKDCEFPIRKGPLTMVEEGNAGVITNSFRIGKSVRLVRDIQGNSLYLFTNVTCPYRRAGAGAFTEPTRIPYGSGTLSGVVVHETHTRYSWADTDDEDTYGQIGAYQLRHQRASDIDFKNDFEDGFSAFVVEWQYWNRVNNALVPTSGAGVLSHTSPKYALTAYSNRDYSALAMGSAGVNTGGNGCFLPNGDPLPCNEEQGGNKGKGWFVGVSNSPYASAWSNRYWWDTNIDRGEAWLIEFSTQGLQTDKLSLQISVINSAVKSPTNFTAEWSLHDDSNRTATDWKHLMDYTVPDFAVWASTQNFQSNAFKEINIPLPLEMLGHPAVYIRLRASSPLSSDGGAYRNYDLRLDANKATPDAISTMNYCAIRYNKK
ncbi:MAG: DUF5689 domain-containing protein [Dysgonamonadaceae bacterium]|jgi:hypothetical protein|nr:DUF5689 domain-containing protein [Dysgonamonadaceae bacterium]